MKPLLVMEATCLSNSQNTINPRTNLTKSFVHEPVPRRSRRDDTIGSLERQLRALNTEGDDEDFTEMEPRQNKPREFVDLTEDSD